MQIVGNEVYTLLDYSKQFTESGEELAVAEVLTKKNPMIEDAVTIESNSDAGHLYAVRTGIPEGTWRRAYKGIQPQKGTTKQVTESYGTLANLSIVDKLIAEKGGKVSQVRAGQAKTIIEGMANTMGKTLIYGSHKKNEEQFTGLASRYNTLPTNGFDQEDSSRNVVSAGGSTANSQTSIYLVTWDTDKVFTFFPKGTKAGLQHVDHTPNGPHMIDDYNGGRLPVYEEYFEWKLGLCVQDWRFAGRVCNIQSTTTGANLRAALDELMNRVDMGGGKPVLYMNKATRFKLQQAIDGKSNVYFTKDVPVYPQVMNYNGLPVRVCDFISSTEAVIS